MRELGKAQKISLDGLFIALTFVATFFLVFPLPAVGYFNVGDVIVLLGGAMFGPVTGALSALGAGLADLALGYAIYFPFTVVIKAAEGVVAGFLCSFVAKKTGRESRLIAAFGMAVAGAIMPFGYFMAEWLVLPLVDSAFGMTVAVVSLPVNLLQFGISVVVSCIIFVLLKKALKNKLS